MIVLALLLLVLVAAVVAFVLAQGVDQTVLFSADWIGFSWRPSIIVVFLLGALCLFAAELALALMRGGFRRGRDRRRELKRLRDAERQRAALHTANDGQHVATVEHGASGEHMATRESGASGEHAATGDHSATGQQSAAAQHRATDLHDDTWHHGEASPTTYHQPPEAPADPDAPRGHRGGWYDDPPGH
ncbi:MAG TPA: hypothetical protein VFX33_09035 [Actinomycetales bacterium]|nr:hypothetical protein [Actinomycetales bacterium]